MNLTVLGCMVAIAMAGMAIGYEAFRLGAWFGLGLYVLILLGAVNPRLWWRRW